MLRDKDTVEQTTHLSKELLKMLQMLKDTDPVEQLNHMNKGLQEVVARNARRRESRLARETPEQRALREQRARQVQERGRLLEERRLVMRTIRQMPALHRNMDYLRLFDMVHHAPLLPLPCFTLQSFSLLLLWLHWLPNKY
jgi:hypothetical protein